MILLNKILKVYILLLTSVLLFFFSNQLLIACGGYDENDIVDYSAFAPEIIQQPKYSPYFFTYEQLYFSDPAYIAASSDDFNIMNGMIFLTKK